MFRNRSRLPGMPSQAFDAKSESPNTTMRVSGLFGSWLGAVGRRRRRFGAVAGDDRAASEIGPALSPLSSSRSNLPVVVSVLMSVSAQLFGLVSTSVCVNFPLAPPSIGDRSGQRIGGQQVERDR